MIQQKWKVYGVSHVSPLPSPMTITIHLERRQVQFSSTEQALAKAVASRQAMRFQLQAQLAKRHLSYSAISPLHIQEDTLRRMVVKFSEQLVYSPLEEMHSWFAYSSGAFLQHGYPPLFYGKSETRSIVANKSAVAGIGEAIAGFLAQRLYQARKLARPVHDYPDIVMTGQGKTYLVEAKASTVSAPEIRQVLDEELMRLAAYTSACAELDARPVTGLLIGIAIESETHYHCCITEVMV